MLWDMCDGAILFTDSVYDANVLLRSTKEKRAWSNVRQKETARKASVQRMVLPPTQSY